MRTIDTSILTDRVREMCRPLAMELPADVKACLEVARSAENCTTAVSVLGDILDNADLADRESIPMCQDTGAAVVFLEVGLDVHFNSDPYAAINEGIRQGYEKYYLRKSVVADPLRRVNTGDNTPAFINTKLVPGDKVKITLMAKGFGSENMSRLKMLMPADGRQGVHDFVLETVSMAGPNACPPFMVGVGIGGTFDQVALAAKRSLLQNLDSKHEDTYYAEFESQLLHDINQLGVGPQGFGGRTTALAVAIEALPTHIAGLPVAVNIQCHAIRHQEEII
jgi:fumarate hydratase subunit alpha